MMCVYKEIGPRRRDIGLSLWHSSLYLPPVYLFVLLSVGLMPWVESIQFFGPLTLWSLALSKVLSAPQASDEIAPDAEIIHIQ